MDERLITSDAPLSAEQRAILGALLDTIVPESDDGSMPSARELDFAGYLHRHARDFLGELVRVLARFDAGFVAQPLPVRYEAVRVFSEQAPDDFQALLAQVYGCYYQDNRVRRAIGLSAGAPFPEGNTVDPGDLSLLDPVLKNATRWRRRISKA